MESDPGTPKPQARRSGRRGCARWLVIAPISLLVVLGAALAAGWLLFERQYADRIYPGIVIGNVDVGNLTPAEAAQRVQRRYEAQNLVTFEYGKEKWFAPWHEIGIEVKAAEATQQAFNIGRLGRPDRRLGEWQSRQPVAVAFTFDMKAARGFLQSHKAEVRVSPHDARVEMDAAEGVALAVPATMGRELDVEATLRNVFALAMTQQPVPVITREIAPALSDVSGAVNQLNDWMQRPFSYRLWWDGGWITRTVSPQERMNWVRAELAAGRWSAQWNADGVREYLAGVKQSLGEVAELRLDEAVSMTWTAFQRREPGVWLIVPHAEHRYVIEPDDTFDALGDRFGIPVARLISANPDIWEGGFTAGQSITIPNQNIMLPLPITPTNLKRIEVDLTTQTLWAYDGATLAMSATVSSGIPKWRTLAGVFQVLEHVDEAYNKLARIKMPNWLSIYDIGEPGESLTNGIHALPVLSGGRRLWSGYLGTPVSFGCVVLGIEDSDFIYRWAELGTPVLIYGKTPPSPFNYDDLVEAQKKTDQAQKP